LGCRWRRYGGAQSVCFVMPMSIDGA
jgi:hypothetical protein